MSTYQCTLNCPRETYLDPVDGCTCIGKAEMKSYFPKFASKKDIDHSFRLANMPMLIHPEKKPRDERPSCNPLPMCAEGYYWNELTCSCWAEYSH